MLSELLLQGFLAVADDKEKMVSIAVDKPVGDPILDEAMTQSVGCLESNFPPVELQQHKKRIQEIAEGKLLAAGATQEAIAAVQAAITAAVIAASVAATVATTAVR